MAELPRLDSKALPLAVVCSDVSADSERFPVVAAGQKFNCENDGSIYVWVRKPNGFRRKNIAPLCRVEVSDLCFLTHSCIV